MAGEKTAKEIVLDLYPNAFVYDDGESVMIKVRETVTKTCPHCVQEYTTYKHVDLMTTLGHAGNETAAWENAKFNLTKT